MDYRSDIRILLTNKDYFDLKDECIAKYGDNSHFNKLDREETRKDCNGKRYIYFGWDCIEWHINFNNEDRKEVDLIEERLREFEEYHKVRIGEDIIEDIEEEYHLEDSLVEPIHIIRAFVEEEIE